MICRNEWFGDLWAVMASTKGAKRLDHEDTVFIFLKRGVKV